MALKFNGVTITSGQQIQTKNIPEAALKYKGRILQYTGVTNATYTNGYFYKCVEVAGNYSWVSINTESFDFEKLTELEFTWTGHGYDTDLNDGDTTSVNSISIKPVCLADEEVVIDFGPSYNSIATAYIYARSVGWIMNATPSKRLYVFPMNGCQWRLGINEGAPTNGIRIFTRKLENKTLVPKKFDLPIEGRSMSTFGDSIAVGYIDTTHTASKPLYARISETLNLSSATKAGTYNFPVSGSTYSEVQGLPRIKTTIESNLTTVKDCDYMIIYAGINDWARKVPINTFVTALKETYGYIKTNYSGNVIIVAPANPNINKWLENQNSNFEDYRTNIIKYATLYGFYVTDVMSYMPTNFIPNLTSDGVHFSETGYNIIWTLLTDDISGFIKYQERCIGVDGISWTGKFSEDGKPIFKVTLSSTTGETSKSIGYTNIKVVDMYGGGWDTTNYVPLGWTSGQYRMAAFVQFAAGTLNVECPYSNWRITVEFYQ